MDPFGGVSLFGQVNHGAPEKLVNGGTAGGRAAYNFSQHVSIEVNYNFMVNNVRLANSTFGNQIHSLALDPVYNFTPRGWRIQPYITAGAGPTWFVPTKQAPTLLPASSTEFTFNYGGGVKFHLSPHLGLRFDGRGVFSQNPTFALPTVAKSHLNGLQATLGLVFYFEKAHIQTAPAPAIKPAATLQPLNPGEITGPGGQLCQGRALTLHATATDPIGHALAYAWKANGLVVGTNNPDLSFTPNNAGDFQFEVEVSDAGDRTRVARVGPKRLAIQDYVLPAIQSVTASPNTITISSDTSEIRMVKLAAVVAGSACSGNLTYKWTVSEGSLTNDAGPNAQFDAASLSFEAGVGQTKTITATLTATDEAGKSAVQNAEIAVNYPAQFKRLADLIFARNSARVNNCGKRILIEQAALQAGTAFDVLLVGHRGSDESGVTLDRQRLLAAAAVLTGDHGVCANLDVSQVWISAAGTEQISAEEPGLCGTSNIPATAERRGAEVTQTNKEHRVEVYLVPKRNQSLPPAAKSASRVPTGPVKALGCPK